jgi:hypothetical protein
MGRFARPIGAKPFEPARPERLSKAETRDDGTWERPCMENHAVRSAPGRSEREAARIVGLLLKCKEKTIMPLSTPPRRAFPVREPISGPSSATATSASFLHQAIGL